MKVVIDTNVAISGLLWSGPPNQILKWSRDGLLITFGCERTTGELKSVLRYEKFSKRLAALDRTSEEVFAYFMNIIRYVPTPKTIPHIIKADLFDNIFLALALENKTHLIISGDDHLLAQKKYQGIQIVTPKEAWGVIETVLGIGVAVD